MKVHPEQPFSNYPCCTVNHPQAYPRFWAHSFFTDPAGTSLVHALLGPSTFQGSVGTNNPVTGAFLVRRVGYSIVAESAMQLLSQLYIPLEQPCSTKSLLLVHWHSRSVFQLGHKVLRARSRSVLAQQVP